MSLALKEVVINLLPRIKKGEITPEAIEALTNTIRQAMKADPAQGKELGPLLAQISAAVKAQVLKPDVNWVAVANGALAIGHKPGGKIPFEGLQQVGATAVLTLLQETEGADAIGRQVQKAGMQWVWFPFSASRPHEGEQLTDVITLYTQLQQLLHTGGKIYIHCSAGIHRTGMITYGLLRYLGKAKEEATQLLHTLREVTAAQAGEDRLAWGDQFAAGDKRG